MDLQATNAYSNLGILLLLLLIIIIIIIGERDHLGDRDVDGRTILIKMDRKEVGRKDTDWIQLTPDRNEWGALVNTAMNLRFP
jgi:hypothetical protein